MAQGVACGWFLVSCPHNCTNTGWVGISDNADSTSDHHYVNALYWAMATMTTTGYGDFHAHNDSERLFAIAAMLGAWTTCAESALGDMRLVRGEGPLHCGCFAVSNLFRLTIWARSMRKRACFT